MLLKEKEMLHLLGKPILSKGNFFQVNSVQSRPFNKVMSKPPDKMYSDSSLQFSSLKAAKKGEKWVPIYVLKVTYRDQFWAPPLQTQFITELLVSYLWNFQRPYPLWQIQKSHVLSPPQPLESTIWLFRGYDHHSPLSLRFPLSWLDWAFLNHTFPSYLPPAPMLTTLHTQWESLSNLLQAKNYAGLPLWLSW